jgi:hypothetical protein
MIYHQNNDQPSNIKENASGLPDPENFMNIFDNPGRTWQISSAVSNPKIS